jgi:hypothetical protein
MKKKIETLVLLIDEWGDMLLWLGIFFIAIPYIWDFCLRGVSGIGDLDKLGTFSVLLGLFCVLIWYPVHKWMRVDRTRR